MEKYFVPLPEAIELKNIGFKEPCFAYYSGANKKVFYCVDPDDLTLEWVNHSQYDFNNFQHVFRTSAPLYAQAFEWFRKNHKLQSFIESNADHEVKGTDTYSISIFVSFGKGIWDGQGKYNTYEEAELACLEKLIQLAKNGQ